MGEEAKKVDSTEGKHQGTQTACFHHYHRVLAQAIRANGMLASNALELNFLVTAVKLC